ncbi:MAG: abortive infection family protein [Clostridiales bacterium]|nr:abortive infection family protein [Clostridiales bacterium]
MANLTYREKRVLEKLFGMASGYVMDFSNGSFSRFIGGVINIDVYDGPRYKEYASKANKLRQIWNSEPDSVVGILIEALLSYYENMQLRGNKLTDFERKKIEEMRLVAVRLKGNAPNIELPIKQDDSLQTLLEDINNALARNKPELVLDRLHTFSTKLLRQICVDNGISVIDNKGANLPLHSLAGMLRKKYDKDGLFQSSFTLLAIQNSISLFDKYNGIRNDKSYAHDKEVLGTMEAEFAVRIMADLLRFIDEAETYRKKRQKKSSSLMDFENELPF